MICHQCQKILGSPIVVFDEELSVVSCPVCHECELEHALDSVCPTCSLNFGICKLCGEKLPEQMEAIEQVV